MRHDSSSDIEERSCAGHAERLTARLAELGGVPGEGTAAQDLA
jgi:hypothetical protein